MKKGSEYFQYIREQAEQILQGRIQPEDMLSHENVDKVFHELQVHQIELEMQNEELQKTQQDLIASRNKYLQLYDYAPVGYCTLNREGVIQEMNETGSRLFNMARSTLLGKPMILYIAPGDDAAFLSHLKRVFSTRKPQACELRLKLRDRSEREVRLESVIQPGAQAAHTTSWTVMTDISARKYAERQLQAALREKEAMLAEIHHRVKNNLQVISSLLDFQADYVSEPHTQETLRDLQRRIRTMAAIHQQLYRAPDLSQIDVASYVEGLTLDLFTAYSRHDVPVNLKLDIQDVLLDVNKAIPCGLLINELVSNALKYAFPPARRDSDADSPAITVSLFASDETDYTLVVSDNGIGLPSDFTFPNESTLGMFLIETFAEQLDGTVKWNSEGGTTCTIVFRHEQGGDVNE